MTSIRPHAFTSMAQRRRGQRPRRRLHIGGFARLKVIGRTMRTCHVTKETPIRIYTLNPG